MKKIDLNVDIGEGFPHDAALLEFATSANICCGSHAGSWEQTLETIALCKGRGVRIGCHPGFPDRESMGRRIPNQDEDVSAWLVDVSSQVARFLEATKAAYFKPHGAWYNILASPDSDSFPIPIYFPSCGTFYGIAAQYGLRPMMLPGAKVLGLLFEPAFDMQPILEGFADRRYLPDGTLAPRSEPGAVMHDPDAVREQVLQLAPKVDSICLHGDTPDCLSFAESVKRTIVDAGYEVGF